MKARSSRQLDKRQEALKAGMTDNRIDVAPKLNWWQKLDRKLGQAQLRAEREGASKEGAGWGVFAAGVGAGIADIGIGAGTTVVEPIGQYYKGMFYEGPKDIIETTKSFKQKGFKETIKDKRVSPKEEIASMGLGIATAIKERPLKALGTAAALGFAPEVGFMKAEKPFVAKGIKQTKATKPTAGRAFEIKIDSNKPKFSSEQNLLMKAEGERTFAKMFPKDPLEGVRITSTKPKGDQVFSSSQYSRKMAGTEKIVSQSTAPFKSGKAPKTIIDLRTKPTRTAVSKDLGITVEKTFTKRKELSKWGTKQEPSKAFKDLFGEVKTKDSKLLEEFGISIEKVPKETKVSDLGITISKTTTKPKKRIQTMKDVLGGGDDVLKGTTKTSGGQGQVLIQKLEAPKTKLKPLKQKQKVKTKQKVLLKLEDPIVKKKLKKQKITFYEEPALIKKVTPLTATINKPIQAQAKSVSLRLVPIVKNSQSKASITAITNKQTSSLTLATAQAPALAQGSAIDTSSAQSPAITNINKQSQAADLGTSNKLITETTITKTITKPTRTITTAKLLRDPQIKDPLGKKYKRKLDEEEDDPKKKKKRGLFDLTIGKKGNLIYKEFKNLNLEEATKIAKMGVLDTAAASLRVRGEGGRKLTSIEEKKLEKGLGTKFRRGKSDSSLFVQKRSTRISSYGELRDITFKGISSSKRKKSLTSNKKANDKALKLVGKGIPLRKARSFF